jgi:hypothetical protein
METRTVHISDPLAEGLYWHFQVGQRVTVPNSDYGATVVDAWTEGEFSEVGNITAVSGAEVFYRVRTDDGREFTASFRELAAV